MAVDLAEFEESDVEVELEALRKANLTLERKLRTAKAKTADLIQAVYEGARDAAVITGNPPAVPKPSSDRRSKRAEVALLLLSDWHFGKLSPSYDMTVAAERVRLLGQKTAKMVEIERADHPVREVHALLNGDFVESTGIFPGQVFEVDSTTFQQLFVAAASLEELLRHLLSVFPVVQAWEMIGNHGRIGKKGDYPRSDNVDLLVYRLARERLRPYETKGRLIWHEPQSWYSIVEIGAYRSLLVHGDQIKSFGGTPVFAILKKCNSWASGVLPPFLDVCMGHFHTDLKLSLANGRGRVFVNPSIESDSAYAAEVVAAAGVPAQRLNFVDPERGRVTTERMLWLDQVAA